MHRHHTAFPAALALVSSLLLAACGGGDTVGGGAPADDAPASGTVQVVGTDSLAFEPATLTARAGEVTVELTTEDGVNHDFVIEELDDLVVAEAGAGDTDTGTVELGPGVYTFYCSVPGHRPAGMEGTLTVE